MFQIVDVALDEKFGCVDWSFGQKLVFVFQSVGKSRVYWYYPKDMVACGYEENEKALTL